MKIDSLLLASVQWFKPHLDKDAFGEPTQIWQHNDFEVGALYTCIPVKYLKCQCSFSNIPYNDESVLVVVTLAE